MSSSTALVLRDDLSVTTARRAVRWWPVGVSGLLAATTAGHVLLTRAGVVERATTWAGSTSWKAWFFGTLDPAAGTAVGAPAADWIPALAVRYLGSAWADVPGIALGVLTVALTCATVRRLVGTSRGAQHGAQHGDQHGGQHGALGSVAGVLAGAVLAVCLPFEARHTAPALAVVLAGWLLLRGRALVAGLALGGAVLAAGIAGLGALVVLAALVGFVRRRPGAVARLGLGAVLVLGAWSAVAWGWPDGHPAVSWRGSVAGVVVPTVVVLGVAAGAELWRTRRSRLVRFVLLSVLVAGAGVWTSTARTSTARTSVIPTVPQGISALLADTGTTWSAAAVTDEEAAALELASGTSVLVVGPPHGMTLAQLRSYVATGRVTYLVDPGSSSALLRWVEANSSATRVDGVRVHDLTDQGP